MIASLDTLICKSIATPSEMAVRADTRLQILSQAEIALFIVIDYTIVALFFETALGAPVAVAVVTAIALLSNSHDTIPTAGRRTVAIATIAIDEVAVIALLSSSYDTVAAARQRTVAIAVVAVDEVAIIAFFTRIKLTISTASNVDAYGTGAPTRAGLSRLAAQLCAIDLAHGGPGVEEAGAA